MATQQQTPAARPQQIQQQEDTIDLKELFYRCLAKWRWFAVTVAIALALAILHLLTTPPTYLRSASLMIKEDGKGQSIGDIASMFSDLGLSQSASNVNNELIAIESPSAILETVKRLSLDVNYSVRGTFHKNSLYGTSLPVRVSFDDIADNESASLKLRVREDSTLTISDFKKSGAWEEMEDDSKVEARLGQTVETPIGLLTLRAGAGFQSFMEDEPSEITVTRTNIYSTVENVQSNFSASVNGDKSTVIDLTYKDAIIQRAEDMLNTLIMVYKESWMRDKNEMIRSTSMFINDRLAVIERELGDVDEDISTYKSEQLLPDVEIAADLYMTQSKETENKLLELNTRLSMANYIRSYLASGSGENQLLPVNSGIESASIEKQIGDYNTMQLERNNLVANSSERNPLVVKLDASLKQMRDGIMSSIDNYVITLETQIDELQKSERQTNSQISSKPDQAKYLTSVGRQQKVKEALYLFLLQKREESELSQAFTAYNTRIITPPSGSFTPVAPSKKSTLAFALLLGLAIPCVVVVMRELMDTTLRGRKDLERVTVPFLGEIPLTGDSAKKKKAGLLNRFKKNTTSEEGVVVVVVVVRKGERDIANEAFRVLRTNLEFMMDKEPNGNVIVVTSFNAGSGKSFITMNLAISLAIKSKRVLVIDGDLRHGSSSKFVDSPRRGLSDYLAGGVSSLDEIIVNFKEHETLDVLPIGTIPPNPTELLYDERLPAAIDGFRSRYDFILIDCPPVEIVADTQILDQYADRTIFVVRAGLLERSMIPELQNLYDENKYKSMAVVLNGTESSQCRYGYHYGYHSYGYSYDGKKN